MRHRTASLAAAVFLLLVLALPSAGLALPAKESPSPTRVILNQVVMSLWSWITGQSDEGCKIDPNGGINCTPRPLDWITGQSDEGCMIDPDGGIKCTPRPQVSTPDTN